MKGFDEEFVDLGTYIRVITDRIWEGRQVQDIRRYYSDDCAVETPTSVTVGVQHVVDGTHATLQTFPDRRLLAEDVIQSGNDVSGYLSSHRIFSPMTHAGPGVFGPASGRPIYARTIADCVCLENRIIHEWLIRDQAAIARQIGIHESQLAQRWLNERGGFHKSSMPAPPPGYVSYVDSDPLALRYSDRIASDVGAERRTDRTLNSDPLLDPAVISALPGGSVAVGALARQDFWKQVFGAIRCERFVVEHLVANTRPSRPTAVAIRWRVNGRHEGAGRYAEPTGRAVEVMGICHAEFSEGRLMREWVLVDEVAIWMQVLQAQSSALGTSD